MRLHDYLPPLVAEASPDVSTLGMVAVYPTSEQAEALAVEGGLEPAELHCTLVFLGEVADLPDDDVITSAVARVALELAPLEGTVGGVGRFAETPDGIPVLALPDVQGLTMLRERVVDELGAAGVRSPSEHGFLPHMTLDFMAADEEVDLEMAEETLGQPLTFDRVTVVLAGERYDYELTGARVAAAMYSVPTPEELTAATQRVAERLQADHNVDPLAQAYEAVLKAAGRRMARSFAAQAIAVTLTADSRFVPPDEDEVVNADQLAEEIAELAREVRRNAARVVVAELDEEGISYDVDTVFTDELLDRIASNAAFNIDRELRDTYRNTLEVAAEFGWSVSETADALRNKITDLAPHTARAIARTELNGLANGGSVHVASKTVGKDQQLYKNWLATGDDRTRESHVEANGQSVLVNERFVVGGASLNYPGEPFGPAEEVINCRCTVTYSSEPEGTVVIDPDAPAVDLKADPLANIFPSKKLTDKAADRWEGAHTVRVAEEHHIDLPELKRQIEERLKTELAAPDVDVRIRTPADVALEVAKDGRLVSQFESGQSRGLFAPEVRAKAEKDMFSLKINTNPAERPVYGYLGGVTHEYGIVDTYGDVVWVLKHEVRDRTTFTSTDSLNSGVVPSPVNRPSVLSAYPPGSPIAGFRSPTTPLRDWTTVYFEAQVHGGVSLDDVARVELYYHEVISGGPMGRQLAEQARRQVEADATQLRVALAQRGIEVVVKPYPGELTGSGDQLAGDLGLGDDSLEVDVAGGLVPVAPGHDAQDGQLVVDDAGTLVEHPSHGRAEAVLAPTGEHQERVAAALSDHLHTPDHNGSAGGSQPSGPLPLHAPNEEAPMSTTATQQLADGEVEMVTPIAWDAVLCVEGATTEDGRLLERGAISWRDLPLTLMGMLKTGGWGHEGAEVAGRIDTIDRLMDELGSTGELTSTFGVNQLAPLIADRTVRGVSIDLAVLDWEYRDRDTGAVLSEDDLFIYWLDGREGDIVFTVLEGTIVGATVCPMPAIANAEITLAASAGLGQHARSLIASAIEGRDIGPDDVRLIKVFTPFDRKRGEGLISSAVRFATEAPPRSHFEVTEFPGNTPLTVTDDGRVFGHIATWDTCHVGLPGVCTTAPRSGTDPAYALFHQGDWPVAEGGTVDVGKLMLGTGHADLGASRMEATRHYDKPDMVGAYVRATDGEHGIWVSGVVRPELSAAGLRELRANPPSGDWRSYNGRLELIAVCAVAVPGFPVVADAKANITASGGQATISALIASSGVIVPTSAVKDALIAAGCACEEMPTDDEYVDDLAELGGE